MNENRDYISNFEEKGSINISKDVIASIAAVAILDVDGICGLAGNIGSDTAVRLSKKQISKGVKVVSEENNLTVNATVMMEYGSTIQEVAKKAQKAATDAIENMTGMNVSSVNIHVAGVSFEKD